MAKGDYPGYEIPKEEVLNFLGTKEVSHGIDQATIQLAESDEKYNFYDYPRMSDILQQINLDQIKYYINNEAINKLAKSQNMDSYGIGGYYGEGKVIEDEVSQESFMTPDTVFLSEPKIDPNTLRGIDHDWYAGESIHHPMRSYGMKPAGLAEKIPHETMHASIEGKQQFLHDKFSQEQFQGAIASRVLPPITGEMEDSLIFPASGSTEGTKPWKQLEDIYYGYKDWKLQDSRSISERDMVSVEDKVMEWFNKDYDSYKKMFKEE